MNIKAFALSGVAALLFAWPATAHHSFAMFEQDKVVTLQGTVKEFEWVNPHSWIYLMVPDETGALKEWAIEMGSPVQQTRVGWSPDLLKAGDKVTVALRPLKDGSRGGTIVSVTLPDGKKLGGGGQTNNPTGR
jgi:hypothetical protein